MKKFLVQILDDPKTHWKVEDVRLARALQTAARQIARDATTGPEPDVMVTMEEERGGAFKVTHC